MSDLVERLYTEHGAELVAALALSTDDPYLAEGTAHETFLRAQASLTQLEDRPAARTWLFQTAYRLVRARRTGPRPRHTTAEEHPILGSPGLVAADPLLLRLKELPPAQRDATVLHGLLDMSAEEAATILGVSGTAVEEAVWAARETLGQMDGARNTLSRLIRNARPVHPERLEDLEYVEIDERSVLTPLIAVAALLVLVSWIAARIWAGGEAPTVAQAPPPPATQAPVLAQPPTLPSPSPKPTTDTDAASIGTTACAGCSLHDGLAIPPPTILRAPTRSAGYVLHLRAEHIRRTPKGTQYDSLRTELWLDPGTGDARYEETEPESGTRTIHVRKGNLYSVLAPPADEIVTQTLPDASNPYAGPPQDQVFKYKPLLDRGGISGAKRVRLDGRDALVFETGEYRYGENVSRVWVDRQTGILLREITYWVNIRNVPTEIDRHFIRYTLTERLPREELPESGFTLVRTPGERAATESVQPGSPLAIPPATLSELGLQLSGEMPDPRLVPLLEEYDGENLFRNLWSTDGDAAESEISAVLDERYSFPSARQARAFVERGALDTFNSRVPGFGEEPRVARRGNRTLHLKRASSADGSIRMMYLFAFQVENIAARVGVAGGSQLSEKQALDLAWAAQDQVRATLGK